MKKEYLFTPGPTPVPWKVKLAMIQRDFHHRTQDFQELLKKVRQDLQWLFQTKQPVFCFASSGTGAMESAIVNLFAPGDRVIYVQGGKFGKRWGEMGRAYGLEMVEISVPWGEAVAVEKVLEEVEKRAEVKAVLLQACETSTGVRHPVEEIAKRLKDAPVLTVVDAITALGVWDLPMDDLGIDVLIGGSQKGVMLPPGLSFVAVSQRAWEAVEREGLPRYYFDWRRERKAYEKGSTAFTPATGLLAGLAASLEMMKEEGRTRLFERHARLSALTREKVERLGFSLFPKVPAPGLTVVSMPSEKPSSLLIQEMKKRFGILLANGQEHLKDKIFRIAHMGYFTESDVLQVTRALEEVAFDLGVLRRKGCTRF